MLKKSRESISCLWGYLFFLALAFLEFLKEYIRIISNNFKICSMPNELLLFIFFVFLSLTVLAAFRLGRWYVFVLIAVFTVLMNIFVVKQFDVFGLVITWGNALYGAIFLWTDLLAEHYGKKEAFKAVFVWFMAMLLFVICTQFFLWFQAHEQDFAHESMSTLFSLAPRILLGSMLAFLVAQIIDIYLFDTIKKWTKGKYLFLRNNGSTFISQAIDTFIFTFVGLTTIWGFQGVISWDIFWTVFFTTYIIKIVIALIDTPFLYLSYKIKK